LNRSNIKCLVRETASWRPGESLPEEAEAEDMTGTWRVGAAVLADQFQCDCLVGWGERFLVRAPSPLPTTKDRS